MRNLIKILSVLAIILLLELSNPIHAQKLSLYATIGTAFPRADNIKTGLETGFGISYPLNQKINISFDLAHRKSTVDTQSGKLYEGKLSFTPFLVRCQYNFFLTKSVNPYVFVGGGIVFSSFRMGDIITIPEITIRQKVKNGPALYFGIGTDLSVAENLAVFGEAVYLYRNSTGETIITSMDLSDRRETFSLDLSTMSLRLGIKFII